MLPTSLSFARPSFLLLLLAVPILGLLAILATRSRRNALASFGRPDTVAGQSTLKTGSRRRSRVIVFLGLIGLMIAVAGPRWGKGGDAGVVVGRDLVVIFDMSRSMTAADMADANHRQRWESARASLLDLVAEMQRKGGHRLALVLFAARPWVACPLTSDYDHFRARLDEFTPMAPPPELRPEPDEPLLSGTSIGAAIRLALTTHDPRFLGYQDILLISDGDGPDVETESEQGVRAAAERQIPIHTVGVGDPSRPTELVLGEGENAEFVGTKLQERLLKEIARRSKGEYLPAQREVPAIGDWFARAIEPRPSRELSDDALPQPKDRSIWFLAIGLLLLLLGWMVEP